MYVQVSFLFVWLDRSKSKACIASYSVLVSHALIKTRQEEPQRCAETDFSVSRHIWHVGLTCYTYVNKKAEEPEMRSGCYHKYYEISDSKKKKKYYEISFQNICRCRSQRFTTSTWSMHR